jgi:penicillin-binding protein 1A
VISPQVAAEMNVIMNKVVEEGTAKRAQLDGIKAAGKTGTTNNYRDAWFVGFTGNFVAGVWAGNDDYAPTNRMTGGSMPAMTWREIMVAAHQGVELKPIPGVAPFPHAPAVVASESRPGESSQAFLTRRGTETLVRVERMMEDASRALAKSPARARSVERQDQPKAPQGTVASAQDGGAPRNVRGN